MSAAFDLALKAANQSQKLARGVSSSIVVSSEITLSDITIVPAETLRQSVDGDIVIDERLQDWLITVADCDSNEPTYNWKINVGSDVYQLIEGNGRTVFRFHDAPTNSVYRVFTRLTSGASG